MYKHIQYLNLHVVLNAIIKHLLQYKQEQLPNVFFPFTKKLNQIKIKVEIVTMYIQGENLWPN